MSNKTDFRRFYEHHVETFFGENYYELGIPDRTQRDCIGSNPMCKFVATNNGKKDLYSTIYSYQKLDQRTCDYDTRIFDKLVLDLDFEYDLTDRHCRQAYELSEFLTHHGWQNTVLFSGGRGFHIYCLFESVQLDNHYDVLYEVKRVLSNAEPDLDTVAFNSRAQMMRIPNTQHQDTGLYARPVPKDTLLDAASEVLELAQQPDYSFRWPDKKSNGQLVEQLLEYDNTTGQRKSVDVDIMTDTDCSYTNGSWPSVNKGSRELALTFFAMRLRDNGYSKDDTMETMVDWNKNNNPPLPRQKVKYKVNYLYRTGYDKVGPCYFAKQAFNGMCQECPWRS